MNAPRDEHQPLQSHQESPMSTLTRSPSSSRTESRMSTAVTPVPASTWRDGVRRVTALARLELRMLIRNRTALFNALALGPLMVLFVSSFQMGMMDAGGSQFAATLLGALVVFALVFACYYNLCTTAVARREELMLKRLTTGELRRGEVLVAMAAPAFAVILAQVVLGGVAVVLVIGVPAFTNPALALLGLLLGFAAMAALGYATAIITRTVEAAQITTLLPLGALIILSGATFPFALMPDTMRTVAELTPLGAVNALMSIGLAGTTIEGTAVTFANSFAAAVQPLLVLVGWTALGWYLVDKKLPWEPRR